MLWGVTLFFGNSVKRLPFARRNFTKLKPKFAVESKALINTVDTITYCRIKAISFASTIRSSVFTILRWAVSHTKRRSHFNSFCPRWIFPLRFHHDKSLRVFEWRRALTKKVNPVSAHVVHSTEACLGLWATTGVSLLSCWMLQSDEVLLLTPPCIKLGGTIYPNTELEAT